MTQGIEDLRKEIDNVDEAIINLLSKRKELVKNIAQIKKESKKPIFDNNREQQIIEKIKLKAKEKSLDENFINSVYGIILKNSKQEQERIVKH